LTNFHNLITSRHCKKFAVQWQAHYTYYVVALPWNKIF